MKKHKHTEKEDEPLLRSKKGNARRDRKICHRNKKGPHEYELKKPNFIETHPDYRGMTAEEYYKKSDERDKEQGYGYWGSTRWWICVHCGHIEWDQEQNPNKKIREHIWKK